MSSKILFSLIICVILAISGGTGLAAGISANGPDVAAKIRAMGANLNPDIIAGTLALYAPLLAQAPKDGVKVAKDEQYGAHERHKLDIYEPEKMSANPAPVLLFLHGGGFVRGDKNDGANVCTWFARQGLLAISMNYRFAPEIQWPQGAEDIAAALRWIKNNAKKYAGDPNRIFLMGTSAGAAHVMTYVFFEDVQIKDGDGVAGAILLSCPTFDTSVLNDRDMVYYGKDTSRHPAMSAVKNVDGRVIPLFLVIAELDPASIFYQNYPMIDALYKRDKILPFMKTLIGHNHVSEIYHFNTKDESLGPDVIEFINIAKGK